MGRGRCTFPSVEEEQDARGAHRTPAQGKMLWFGLACLLRQCAASLRSFTRHCIVLCAWINGQAVSGSVIMAGALSTSQTNIDLTWSPCTLLLLARTLVQRRLHKGSHCTKTTDDLSKIKKTMTTNARQQKVLFKEEAPSLILCLINSSLPPAVNINHFFWELTRFGLSFL